MKERIREWEEDVLGARSNGGARMIWFYCYIAVVLFTCLVLLMSSLDREFIEIFDGVEAFFFYRVAPIFGGIMLLVNLFGGDRDVKDRIIGIIESFLSLGALWLFFYFVFSQNGRLPFVVFRFFKNASINTSLGFFQSAYQVLAYVLYYIILFSPIILLAIMFRVFSGITGSYTLVFSNSTFHILFRLLCFFALLFGFVILRPAYRYEIISGNVTALFLSIIGFLPVGFVSYCILN